MHTFCTSTSILKTPEFSNAWPRRKENNHCPLQKKKKNHTIIFFWVIIHFWNHWVHKLLHLFHDPGAHKSLKNLWQLPFPHHSYLQTYQFTIQMNLKWDFSIWMTFIEQLVRVTNLVVTSHQFSHYLLCQALGEDSSCVKKKHLTSTKQDGQWANKPREIQTYQCLEGNQWDRENLLLKLRLRPKGGRASQAKKYSRQKMSLPCRWRLGDRQEGENRQ